MSVKVPSIFCLIDPFSATKRYRRHRNKVKVKGLAENSI